MLYRIKVGCYELGPVLRSSFFCTGFFLLFGQLGLFSKPVLAARPDKSPPKFELKMEGQFSGLDPYLADLCDATTSPGLKPKFKVKALDKVDIARGEIIDVKDLEAVFREIGIREGWDKKPPNYETFFFENYANTKDSRIFRGQILLSLYSYAKDGEGGKRAYSNSKRRIPRYYVPEFMVGRFMGMLKDLFGLDLPTIQVPDPPMVIAFSETELRSAYRTIQSHFFPSDPNQKVTREMLEPLYFKSSLEGEHWIKGSHLCLLLSSVPELAEQFAPPPMSQSTLGFPRSYVRLQTLHYYLDRQGVGTSFWFSTTLVHKLLAEIVKVQFKGDASKLRIDTLLNTYYLSPAGRAIPGYLLFSNKDTIFFSNEFDGDEAMEKRIETARKHLENAVGVFEYHDEIASDSKKRDEVERQRILPGIEKVDLSDQARNSLATTEPVLREFLQRVVAGKLQGLSGSTALLTEDHKTHGTFGHLLVAHTMAKYRAEHPGLPADWDLEVQKVTQLPGYQPEEVLRRLLLEAQGKDPLQEPYKELAEALKLQDSSGRHLTREIAALERLLRAIFERVYEQKPDSFKYASVRDVIIHAPKTEKGDGPSRTMKEICTWYGQARARAAAAEGKRGAGFGAEASFQYFREKVLQLRAFEDMERPEFERFVERARLRELLDAYRDDAVALVEVLAQLRPKLLEQRDLSDFVRRYVGLYVENILKQKEFEGQLQNAWLKRKLFLEGLMAGVSEGRDIDFTAEGLRSKKGLLIKLSRREFDADPQGLLAALAKEAENYQPEKYPAVPAAVLESIRSLYHEVAAHFLGVIHFEVKGMTTQPFPYQREGIQFGSTREALILADEAGLGKTLQAIGIAQTTGARRVLWITNASNKSVVHGEILEHGAVKPEEVAVVISGDRDLRRSQMASLNGERYIVTNYETLVAMRETEPEHFQNVTGNLDMIVIDEGQLIDNEDSARSQVVHSIPAKRKVILTATPYQNKVENLWSLLHYLYPQRFPDKAAFKAIYTQNTEGLAFLHRVLEDFMLRRTRSQTVRYFEDPGQVSFAEQLKDGTARLPHKRRLSPQEFGGYELSREQADLIAWMTADFRGWAEHFNAHLPEGEKPLDLDRINAFVKLDKIQKAIYEPHKVGLYIENPLFEAFDREVDARLARGEKISLWAWNKGVIDELEERYLKRYATKYPALKIARIDGTVTDTLRDDAINRFQNDPDTRILVANYVSGGVGLTLTAAHCALLAQLPFNFPLVYQVEGRIQRVIGLENMRFAKKEVQVGWAVPRFPQDFVAGVADEKLRHILEHGTLIEQTYQRLLGGELLYNLVMEGYADPTELEKYFTYSILATMGLKGDTSLEYHPSHALRLDPVLEGVRRFRRLYDEFRYLPAAREDLLKLIDRLGPDRSTAKALAQAFEEGIRQRRSAIELSQDLSAVLHLFDVPNRYVRGQLFKHLPSLMSRLYEGGQGLAQSSEGQSPGRLTATSFLGRLFLRGAGSALFDELYREIEKLPRSPEAKLLEERFLMGLVALMDRPDVQGLLAEKTRQDLGADLATQVRSISQLGLTIRAGATPPLKGHWPEQLNRAVHEVLAAKLHLPQGQLAEAEDLDHVLALYVGWEELKEPTLLRDAQETLQKIVTGHFQTWRYGGEKTSPALEYLSHQKAFWAEWAANYSSKIETPEISPKLQETTLLAQYESLKALLVQENSDPDFVRVDGDETVHELRRLLFLPPDERLAEVETLKGALKEKGEAIAQAERNSDPISVLSKLRRDREKNGNLLAWLLINEDFEGLRQGTHFDGQRLLNRLLQRRRRYEAFGVESLADSLSELSRSLEHRLQNATSSGKAFEIRESDDPRIFLRIGMLHPELSNCFNAYGNPHFNRAVLNMAGSKNQKVLLVYDDKGQIQAVALYKLRRLEDGKPALFLERGLYRGGYDFRSEMAQFLEGRSQKLEGADPEVGKVRVFEQIYGRAQAGDPKLYSTGGYASFEYVEALFGLRPATSVWHRGREVDLGLPLDLTRVP